MTILGATEQQCNPSTSEARVDFREQLYNVGEVGPIEQVQVSTERIAQINGILYDLDPGLYQEGPLLGAVPQDPRAFYDQVAAPWLGRHPVLRQAEVRVSGTGLHALLWLDPPVLIESDGDRQRWKGIIEVVQTALPIDPSQPSITALTRPVGSVNSKNGAKVEQLNAGVPVTPADVLRQVTKTLVQPENVCRGARHPGRRSPAVPKSL